jgi:hypothetical protein
VAGALRGAGLLLRLLHFSTPHCLLGQQEVERGLDDLLSGSARLSVTLPLSSGLQLVEELLRDRHVQALEVGGEGLRLHRNRLRRRLNELSQGRFTWLKRCRARHLRHHLGHHLPPRNHSRRADLHRERLRLLLRQVEEPRQDVCAVLRRDDPGQLDHAADAQLAFPERCRHLGELLDEPCRHLSIVRRSLRQFQIPVQVVEDAGMAQLHPEPLPVEVGERHQEVGHGALLAAEEIGETSGRFACLVHARSISRDFRLSPGAQNRLLARFHADLPRTSPEAPGAPRRPRGDIERGFRCAASSRKVKPRDSPSSEYDIHRRHTHLTDG